MQLLHPFLFVLGPVNLLLDLADVVPEGAGQVIVGCIVGILARIHPRRDLLDGHPILQIVEVLNDVANMLVQFGLRLKCRNREQVHRIVGVAARGVLFAAPVRIYVGY